MTLRPHRATYHGHVRSCLTPQEFAWTLAAAHDSPAALDFRADDATARDKWTGDGPCGAPFLWEAQQLASQLRGKWQLGGGGSLVATGGLDAIGGRDVSGGHNASGSLHAAGSLDATGNLDATGGTSINTLHGRSNTGKASSDGGGCIGGSLAERAQQAGSAHDDEVACVQAMLRVAVKAATRLPAALKEATPPSFDSEFGSAAGDRSGGMPGQASGRAPLCLLHGDVEQW
eukprot:26906-Chlamydomonas_euryale.AAC.6